MAVVLSVRNRSCFSLQRDVNNCQSRNYLRIMLGDVSDGRDTEKKLLTAVRGLSDSSLLLMGINNWPQWTIDCYPWNMAPWPRAKIRFNYKPHALFCVKVSENSLNYLHFVFQTQLASQRGSHFLFGRSSSCNTVWIMTSFHVSIFWFCTFLCGANK